MHLSMLSRRGGRQGIGRGFDFFAKNVVKFPTPGLKFCVKSTKKSPPRGNRLYKLINNVSAYILPENVNTAAEMVLSRSDKRKY